MLLNSSCLAQEQAKIVSVFDGDTLIVKYHGKDKYVSLQFVDCYEAYKSDKAYKEAYLNHLSVENIINNGQAAKNYVETLVKPEDVVTLEIVEDYGVITARVYLKNGKMLNKLLLDSKKCE